MVVLRLNSSFFFCPLTIKITVEVKTYFIRCCGGFQIWSFISLNEPRYTTIESELALEACLTLVKTSSQVISITNKRSDIEPWALNLPITELQSKNLQPQRQSGFDYAQPSFISVGDIFHISLSNQLDGLKVMFDFSLIMDVHYSKVLC